MTKKVPTFVKLHLKTGQTALVRPELIASIVLGEDGEVVMSNYQTALKCTLESAEVAAAVMLEYPSSVVILPTSHGH